MHHKLTCYIQAIEMCTPGIMNWAIAKDVYLCKQPYQLTQEDAPTPDILPPREKRRASHTVNLSLHIADNLQQQANIDANKLRCVFASSDGDMDVFHYLANALSQPEPSISPMMFHQSLHNSAAGYWNIATKSNQASISISAGNDTFSSGLLTAVIDVCIARMPVLFVAYNVTSPSPMDVLNHMLTWFGAGFIFTHERTENSIAKITCSLINRQDASTLSTTSLHPLCLGNPIARGLPLLERIANRSNEPVHLDYLDCQSLKIEMEAYYL